MIKSVITNIKDFKNWLKTAANPIAFDTEGTSLNMLIFECTGFSLADENQACYVKVRNPIEYLKLIIDRKLIMHNAVFDLKVLYQYGLEPQEIFCTLVGAKLIDSDRVGYKPYSLKTLAVDWLRIPKSQVLNYEDAAAFGEDSEQFASYAMNDAIWTYMLYKKERAEHLRQKLDYLMDEVEMPFQYVIRDMELNGVLIDKTELERLNVEVQKKIIQTEAEILGIFGLSHTIQYGLFGDSEYISPVNFNSTPQVVRLIEEELGFLVDEYTEKKNKSVGTEYLKRMMDKHPFFKLYSDLGHYEKMMSTYIKPYFHHVDSDGRCRGSHTLLKSGRLSMNEPNLQQLPNPKKKATPYNFRNIIVAPEGRKLIKGDYSGQELRVLAEVSNDANIIDAFTRGQDLHLKTANFIFDLGLTDEQITEGTEEFNKAKKVYEVERYNAKNGANFPIVYGTSASGISARMGVDRAEAKRWMDGFFELYPGVKEAIDITKIELRKREFVSTLMGRRRRWKGYNDLDEYGKAETLRQAFNHKVQGFSADIGKIAGARLRRALLKYDAKIILFVHDEFVVECAEKDVAEVTSVMKEIMEQAVLIKVPLIVEMAVVERFGE